MESLSGPAPATVPRVSAPRSSSRTEADKDSSQAAPAARGTAARSVTASPS